MLDRHALDTAGKIESTRKRHRDWLRFTRWMISISYAVRSLSQPSFLSTPSVNSG